MTVVDEHDDEYCDDSEGDYCCECGGDGWIVTCCDDICHGVGYCIHGDGMQMCACNDDYEPPQNAPRDWRWTPKDVQR